MSDFLEALDELLEVAQSVVHGCEVICGQNFEVRAFLTGSMEEVVASVCESHSADVGVFEYFPDDEVKLNIEEYERQNSALHNTDLNLKAV